MDFKFPKKEKLKSKKVIDRLFAEGKSVTVFPLKLIYLKCELPEEVRAQVGTVAPKKNIKSAVRRNRIKRLMRESYRLNKHVVFNNSEGSFAFLFLYLGKKMPPYTEIESAMTKTLSKFLKAEGQKGT
ncbi:ribonuclease P protein component [Pseudozobellia thermophila]|uniref:Ribonuclease P protein component n=1 Tax=Pseudozobellia thermophila TaxID=192903 RepID=A0A1M6BFM6_9FLAO|nr:ribonuclease P protein component [Pseudozobellia thermophila]SHI47496.1 ribonuclease P protein component [Pseudozobellia thermophila]